MWRALFDNVYVEKGIADDPDSNLINGPLFLKQTQEFKRFITLIFREINPSYVKAHVSLYSIVSCHCTSS